MLKKLAFIITIFVIVSGILFIVLNILDIAEDYRLDLPIAVFNTIFISAIAVLVAAIAARDFSNSGSLEIIGLGGAVLAFGIGILVYGWFTHSILEVRLTTYDIVVMMAGAIHLGGLILMKCKLSASGLKRQIKQVIILLLYLVIIVIIFIITWLLYEGVLPTFAARDLAHEITCSFSIAAAIICLKTHFVFYYWYSLGLVLFALGVFFLSQGSLGSPVVWLGRVSQYLGGIYFLVAVLGVNQRDRIAAVH
jgi:hypothetical protein